MSYLTSSSYNDTYFAAEEDPKVAVSYLKDKADNWFNTESYNQYLTKIHTSWLAYHGNYYQDSHSISFGGESGELANIAVNHYRNIAQHILTMTTSTRPAFQAKSINTDYESQVQTTLANGLLEYYLREKRLEIYLKRMVEYAVVMGSGFIKMEWNATSGEIYDYIDPDEELISSYDEDDNPLDADGKILKSFPIYQGDVEFKNMSPFDVVYDSTKETIQESQWVICRTFKNKYDLAAKYPELKSEILAMKTKDEYSKNKISMTSLDKTVDIPVYEFFHLKSEALPQGRYVLYLDEDTILMDTPMPYRKLPVYRISPNDILGTPYGYTPMFDLLPLQDAVNSLYSTILTNQNAFGVQSILNPRGNDVRVNQISSGLNFIEYNAVVNGGVSGKPEALNLTNTPPEIFNFLGILESKMEIISGVNSVVRGNPEKSLRSASALALVQTQALQFISSLQQSYIMSIEDIGTGLIQLLQDFASVPRIAEISGKSNKSKMVEFSNKDIDSINRVVVDVGNALSQSTAGRVEMADNLIQMGLIKTPEDYFSVINSGKLETMTEGDTNHNLLIRKENERLVDASSDVIATAIDKHSLHIREHMHILADPDLRLDIALVGRVLAHINEHISLLQTTDPNILLMIGEQPLGPQGGTPPNPQTVAPQQPPQDSLGQNEQLMQNNQAQDTSAVNSAGLPNQPTPPQVPV